MRIQVSGESQLFKRDFVVALLRVAVRKSTTACMQQHAGWSSGLEKLAPLVHGVNNLRKEGAKALVNHVLQICDSFLW